ncbi:hypothetical protein [Rhizobium sp.]|uniref:hypothetical protein n=1 Tax=Rhizobium sp. TaxID=391 RepID=UPI00289B2FB2
MKMSRANQERLPLVLFGGVTLVGIFFIALTKLGGVSPFWSMLIPIVLMIAYWFLSSYLKRLRLHDEQTGDNLYYMGFLFTLTSLGVSLYQFTSDGTMDDVIRNFGIAITSTIFGIGMRIMYNQTRRDVLDIERTTRHDLATMTRQVRTEMDSMRREFVDFRRINHQMVIEGVNEIMESTRETSEKVRQTLEQMVADSMKPLETASQKFGDAINENLLGISEKLGTVVDKVEATARQMESAVLPEAVIKNDLAPLVKEMGTALSQYATAMKTSGQSQSDNSKVVSDSVSKLVEQMSRTMGMLERSIQANGQALQSNVALNQKVEQSTNVQRQMFERVMQVRSQPPIVYTTGGIPPRPVMTAAPPPPPFPGVRTPAQPSGFESINPTTFPAAQSPSTGPIGPSVEVVTSRDSESPKA